MYLGKLAEVASKAGMFQNPLHPYTKVLLSAVPIPNPHQKKERILISGDVPSPINPPSGCRFHTRCPWAFDRCPREEPELLPRDGHLVACHLYD
jgi:oligopeptide/dipeptide ABC transporter ATP-binding protein